MSEKGVAKVKVLKVGDGAVIQHGNVISVHWRLMDIESKEIIEESVQDQVGDSYTLDDPSTWYYNLINLKQGSILKMQSGSKR